MKSGDTTSALFTDRQDAIQLFRALLGKPSRGGWPPTPILAYLGPGGSGKSSLLANLRREVCCLPDGSLVLPHAALDFSQPSAPRRMIEVLIALRDQLQQAADPYGRVLTFPRFDLGALVVRATEDSLDQTAFADANRFQRLVAEAAPWNRRLHDAGANLMLFLPQMRYLVGAIQVGKTLGPVDDFLARLTYGKTWMWFRDTAAEALGDATLRTSRSIRAVIQRLHQFAIPGTPYYERVVNHLLPAAFLADLADPRCQLRQAAWPQANIVIFLDGLEGLAETSGKLDQRLLEALALPDHRRQGLTDRLIVVVGSRNRLLRWNAVDQHPSFEEQTRRDPSPQQTAHARLAQWRARLPEHPHRRTIDDLYLPVWLPDFGERDSGEYLDKFAQRFQAPDVQDPELKGALHALTHGNSLYLALAAAAVMEARTHGHAITTTDLAQFHQQITESPVSSAIVDDHRDETVGHFLLDFLLQQVSATERQQLVFGAAPRALDTETMRAALALPTDQEASALWERYGRYSFTRLSADQRSLIIHPLIRRLLTARLSATTHPQSDYVRVHSRLQRHYAAVADRGNVRLLESVAQPQRTAQAAVESTYHALALGNPDPAIRLGQRLQVERINAIATASASSAGSAHSETSSETPSVTRDETRGEQSAGTARRGRRDRSAWHTPETPIGAAPIDNAAARAADLPTPPSEQWLELLAAVGQAPTALLPSDAYEQAEAAFDRANRTRAVTDVTRAIIWWRWLLNSPTVSRFERAQIQTNLAAALLLLSTPDRREQVDIAVWYQTQALEAFTVLSAAEQGARSHMNLGLAASDRTDLPPQRLLEEAIAHFEASLTVYAREGFPEEWAVTQINLGCAWRALAVEGRQHALQRALDCFEAAADVFTQETNPIRWAQIQVNRATTLADWPGPDRPGALERSQTCLEHVTQILSADQNPYDWALCLNTLGSVYSERAEMVSEDHDNLLRQALHAYEQAGQVLTRDDYPIQWAGVQNNRAVCYRRLQDGDRYEQVQHAVALHRQALTVFTRHIDLAEWGKTMLNLAMAYRQLAAVDAEQRGLHLQEADRILAAVGQAVTRDDLPELWATVLLERASVARQASGGADEAGLRRVVEYDQQALTVFTREAYPERWAMLQANLGIAAMTWPVHSREEQFRHLQDAIHHFGAAEAVFTSDRYPVQFGHMETYLAEATVGLLLAQLATEEGRSGNAASGSRNELYGDAYTHLLNTRLLVSSETQPDTWALAQLSWGYFYRDVLAPEQTTPEEKKECFLAALDAFADAEQMWQRCGVVENARRAGDERAWTEQLLLTAQE